MEVSWVESVGLLVGDKCDSYRNQRATELLCLCVCVCVCVCVCACVHWQQACWTWNTHRHTRAHTHTEDLRSWPLALPEDFTTASAAAQSHVKAYNGPTDLAEDSMCGWRCSDIPYQYYTNYITFPWPPLSFSYFNQYIVGRWTLQLQTCLLHMAPAASLIGHLITLIRQKVLVTSLRSWTCAACHMQLFINNSLLLYSHRP